MAKRKIGEMWTDKRGELKIKTEDGILAYYRYLVEQYLYPHKIPKGITVHHCDFNHTNNSLSNLVLIPTELHIYIHRNKCDYLTSNLELFKERLDNKKGPEGP